MDQFLQRHFFLIALCFCCNTTHAQTYGLKFHGIDKTMDNRTELNLTPDDYMRLEDEFEMSFDFKVDLKKQEGLFGYVFRIINEDNHNIDLLNNLGEQINLNIVNGQNNEIIPVICKNGEKKEWINLRIKFFLSENRMAFYTPDSTYVRENIGFKKHDAFKIIFGANDFKQFKTSDVPPISIKDLKLFEKGKLKYYWPLDQTKKNSVEDRIKGRKAFVKNPFWLRQSHQKWQTVLEKEFNGYVMVTYDPKNDRVFIVGKNELYVYSISSNKMNTVPYVDKPLFFNSSFRAIFNPNNNKIYCYLADGPPLYTLNIETGRWNKPGTPSKFKTNFLHHNSYYYTDENVIYTLGGYGRHKYKNEIRKIDLEKKTWRKLQTNDSIFYPRYLSSLGVLHDTLYILGGYGSATGSQLLNPHSYFDLIGYSLKDSTFFKKFEIPTYLDDMVGGKSMWIDEQTRDYYSLVFEKNKFQGQIQLIKGNLNSPKIYHVGDNIPFKFLDIKTTADLLFSPDQNKLFVYTKFLNDAKTTQFQLSSIEYPPNEYFENLKSENTSHRSKFYYLLSALMLFGGLGILIYIQRNKIKNKKIRNKHESVDSSSLTKVSDENNENIELLFREKAKPDYQLIFFGGFQVFDKNKKDITNKFSPLLKELFLLIWLNTFENDKGISSEKITEHLWFDKDENSARNNRAVNIAKLRNLIKKLGPCELTKKTAYWKFNIEDNSLKSDYLDFLEITSTKNVTKQDIVNLICISEKGPFLYNVQYEWLDKFKAIVSDRIIDTLVHFAEKLNIKNDPEFIIQLSDCIFNFDSVNEEAMMFKCNAQYYMGKHSLAKSTYEHFVREYELIYNQDYKISFGNIIKE